MPTITKQWTSGTGVATIQYGGSGNGQITVSSDDNNLYEQRSMDIVVSTTAGSPTITRTISITQAAKQRIDISAATVTATNQTYSGSAKTPSPTVVLNGTTIPSTGYDVEYSNNTNAGTATITITGKGDYTGTASGTFNIAKANPVYVTPTANNRTYDTTSKALLVAGSNTTPGTFTYCATQSGTYSTIIPSQINAGSYTTWWKFTPTDTNNYNTVGPTSIGTIVSAKTVSNPTITLSQSTYTYSGSACQPTPTVKDGTVTISSSEYTVSYSNNVNAGTGTVTITDKSGGNYTVSGSKTFTINQAIGQITTAPTARSVTYTGSSQYLVTAGSGTGTMYYRYRYKSYTASSWGSWSSFSTSRPSRTNVGYYEVEYYAAASSDGNYTQSTTGTVSVEMAKAASSVTDAPTAKTLIWDGTAKPLVAAGSASGGTMYYKTTTSNSKPSSTSGFSSNIPNSSGAGTYYVWYYVKGDSNHTDTAISSNAVVSTVQQTTYYTINQTAANASPTDIIVKFDGASMSRSSDVDVISWINANTKIVAANLSLSSGSLVCKEVSRTDKTKWANGTPISSPANYDFFVKLPEFWWRCEELSLDQYKISFSVTQVTGYNHWEGNTFIGIYKAYNDNSNVFSRTGVTPTVSVSQENFKTYARNRGTGYTLITYETHCMMALLGYGWLATTSAKTVCGKGTSSYPKTTGGCNALGMTDTAAGGNGDSGSVNFWGLENWWSDIYEFIDNLKVNSSARDIAVLDSGGNSVRTITTGLTADGANSIGKMILGEYGDLIPKLIKSDSNYNNGYCDYGEVSAITNKIARRSGIGNSIINGLCIFLADTYSSSATGSTGSRLQYKGNYTLQ